MNNNTNNITAVADAAQYIQGVYEGYVETFSAFSGITLLVYTHMLAFNEEREHIWLKRFSLPNLLYVFARYGTLILQALSVSFFILPFGSLCNTLANLSNAITVLPIVGIQGLLITRTYSLCQGNKVIGGILTFLFLGGLIANILDSALFRGCLASFSVMNKDIIIVANICVVLTDTLVFGVCLQTVWSTWKLKRETGVRSTENNLVSILIKQTLARFCFVCFITITETVVIQFENINDALITFQQVLSAILIADALLDLRRQNSVAIETRNASLPSFQFGNLLQHIHESIIIEMGNHEDVSAGGEEEAGGDIVNISTRNVHIDDQAINA